MPRLHADFSSGFPCALKEKQWLRESAPRAMEILVYWHIFRRKHGRFQMHVSGHKMCLIFCLNIDLKDCKSTQIQRTE